MNPSDLSLKDLEYVLAVARHGNFSVAAQACSVSQPALSKQIKQLETHIGQPLFERNKRQVLLTEAGQRFVTQASLVMDDAQKLLSLVSQDQQPLSGTFRLGAIASVCPYLLPHFVSPLKTEFPSLKLLVKEGLTDDLVEALKQGKLDAIIAATTFSDETLLETPLFFEPFLLASAKNADKRIKASIDIQDIEPSHLLLLEDGHCLKDQTLAICKIKDDDADFGKTELNVQATSLETLLQMTASGLGVAVVPALAKPKESQLSEALSFSEFKDKANGRTMALYCRSSYPFPKNIQVLAAFIKEHLPNPVHVL